jgi:hypothetical protein
MFSETVRLLMSLKVDRLQDERLQWNASYQGRHWLFFTNPPTNKKTAPENRRSIQNNYLVFKAYLANFSQRHIICWVSSRMWLHWPFCVGLHTTSGPLN